MARHPLDIVDSRLERDGSVEKPLYETAPPLADLLEFASMRWDWFGTRHEELLARVPIGTFDEKWLPEAGAGIELRVPDDRTRGVHSVPRMSAAGWEAGSSFGFFQERFKKALVVGGLPSGFASGLVGCLVEMAANAAEHARSPAPPMAAYEVTSSRWQFCVCDVGVGMQGSLTRNPIYAGLRNDVQALQAAVKDGVSATGDPGRGKGFTDLFHRLVNRSCSIRLRSVGATTSWSGTAPGASEMRISPARRRAGFHITVSGALTAS